MTGNSLPQLNARVQSLAAPGSFSPVEITTGADRELERGAGVGGLIDTVQLGDNVTVLSTLPAECIDLVVTSPPYDDLRTYGGHSWDFAGVARELTRVLKPGGVIVWVVADATVNGSETLTSMRQAIHFKDVCGLNVHDTMIYEKAGTGACGSNLAYWQTWEYAFVLSKGRPKAVNRLTQPNSAAGKKVVRGTKEQITGTRTETKDSRTISDEGIRANIWRYNVNRHGMETTEHPAPFPIALAKDHVASWSNPGDIVCDPFSGSGTTCKAAKELNRHWLGIEVNPAYVKISNVRLSQGVLALFSGPLGGGGRGVSVAPTTEAKKNDEAQVMHRERAPKRD